LERAVTRVLLVRHGATPLTAEDRFSGDAGVDLSADGRLQVQALAERLRDGPIRAIYTSPYERTRQTSAILAAEILAQGRPMDAIPRDGLREIKSKYPEEYTAWEADPFTFAPKGGESGVAVLARALPVLRDIVVAHPDDSVLVVSHKATIRILLASLLGFDARGYRDRLDQAPACLNVVDFKDPVHPRLMLFNDVSHYARETRQARDNLSRWWDAG
jgi:broad specificity phosphatase PhoE